MTKHQLTDYAVPKDAVWTKHGGEWDSWSYGPWFARKKYYYGDWHLSFMEVEVFRGKSLQDVMHFASEPSLSKGQPNAED